MKKVIVEKISDVAFIGFGCVLRTSRNTPRVYCVHCRIKENKYRFKVLQT